MKSHLTIPFIYLLTLITLSIFTSEIFSQTKDFIGTRKVVKDGQTAFETFPDKNKNGIESSNDQPLINNNLEGDRYVLGGSVLWFAQDPAAIANVVAINSTGNLALTGWGLNSMRASLYTDANNIPLWDFFTGTYDPYVDISNDGSKIAVTKGTDFYLLDPANGNINFQFTLPDSFYASVVSVSRDGSMAVVLANALGSSTTYRAYVFDITASPSIIWMFDVQGSEIINWAGANFSADGNLLAITGRNHLYIFNSSDGDISLGSFC